MFPEKTIVIDNGAHTIKVGYASDEKPIWEVPTSTEENSGNPIKRGVIVNWEAMKARWDYIYSDVFGYDFVDSNVLITDPAHGSMEQKIRITKRMFENYHCANLSLADPGVLALNSMGITTGISVDSGHEKTSIVPVQHCKVMRGVFRYIPIGGEQFNERLLNLIKHKSQYLLKTGSIVSIVDIKHKLAYVSLDGNEAKVDEVSYELPDGQIIKLNEEQSKCPEVFFAPNLMELEGLDGLPDVIIDTVKKIGPVLVKQLVHNVVLSGGSTSFRNLPTRLEAELGKRLPKHRKYAFRARVLIEEKPEHSTWKGGALRAKSTSFWKMCISSDEYYNNCPSEDSTGLKNRTPLENLLKRRCDCY